MYRLQFCGKEGRIDDQRTLVFVILDYSLLVLLDKILRKLLVFFISCFNCQRKKGNATFILAVGTNNGDIFAIDAFTGDTKWKSGGHQSGYDFCKLMEFAIPLLLVQITFWVHENMHRLRNHLDRR